MSKEMVNGNGRIQALIARQKQIESALAAERLKRQNREKREMTKEENLIGVAVIKAAAVSADFRLMIAQTALAHVTDEKQRRFLADRGWKAPEKKLLDPAEIQRKAGSHV
jgi:hypothetical protein